MTSTTSGRYGLDYFVPTRNADDPWYREGADELLGTSLAFYNAALDALRKGNPHGALAHAESAVQAFPYAPLTLELGIALHAKHGDVGRAYQLKQHLAAIGGSDVAEAYAGALAESAQRWSVLLSGPLPSNASPRDSYRELLFLTERHPDGLSRSSRLLAERYGLSVRQQQAAPPPSTPTVWRWSTAIAGAAALGLAAYIAVSPPSGSSVAAAEPAAEDARPVTEAAQAIPVPTGDPVSETALRFISEEAPLAETVAALDSIRTAATAEQAARAERLYRLLLPGLRGEVTAAWHAGDYDRVLELMGAGGRNQPSAPEDLYRMGLAYAERGEKGPAIVALERSIEEEGAYYEAEALYRLVLLTGGAEQVRYARALTSRYPGSIYDNSKISTIIGR